MLDDQKFMAKMYFEAHPKALKRIAVLAVIIAIAIVLRLIGVLTWSGIDA